MTAPSTPPTVMVGRDYRGARDDFVYIWSHDHASAYERADRCVLARVPKDRLRERAAYEFFVALDGNRQPVWTEDVRERGAVLTHPGASYRSGISYNPGLKRASGHHLCGRTSGLQAW